MSSDRFHMDKNEEVADANERYRSAPAPGDAVVGWAAPPAPGPAAAAAPPPAAAVAPIELRLARLATAGAALALALAFFYPALRDALDGDRRAAPIARDGEEAPAEPSPPPPVPRMYLLVNATPAGAAVTIDGAEAGHTPLMTNVPCIDGAPIRVVITARGYRTHTATVPCTADARADVSPTLKRSGP